MDKHAPTRTNHLVAIDLGSNSFHLIIAREQDGCLQIMHRQKQTVSLAKGLDKLNNLSEPAMNKAIDCLHEFNLALANIPNSAIRIVATQALRQANNSQQFINLANKSLPYPIEVISGQLEAELIYKGVAHTQPLRGSTFIIDIGGGSTELVIGHNFATSLTDSLAMGCISIQKIFFTNGEITETAMQDAISFAVKQLTGVADRYRELHSKTLLGTSGSIKAISQVMLELYGDDKITAKRLKRLVKQLIGWQHCNNIPLRSLDEARRPLLASAVAILSSCFSQLGLEQMKFSTGGLREGVLYDLSQSRTDIDTRDRTIHNLMRLHHIDRAFSQRVLQQLTLMNKQLKNTSAQLNQTEFTLLCWAAQLHEIGIAVNSKKRQHHGGYILEHSDMPGFSESEKNTLVLLVRSHRGQIKLNTDEQNQLITTTQRTCLLIQILRLSIILTQGRLQTIDTQVKVFYENNVLIVALTSQPELQSKLNNEVEKQASAGLALTIKT
ncbi:MAG: Ppx/GppA phosphatase family protein [Colwellia sp.]|nr:Ppx/GppA phosphatase family protein [Colwellia sp.]